MLRAQMTFALLLLSQSAVVGCSLPDRDIRTASAVCSLAFGPDGSMLYSGNETGEIVARQLKNLEQQFALRQSRDSSISRLSISADGSTLLGEGLPIGVGDKVLWDLDARKQRLKIPSQFIGETRGAVLSPDGRTIALLASSDDTSVEARVKLISTSTGKVVMSCEAAPKGNCRFGPLCCSRDGGTFAVAAIERASTQWTVVRWDARTGRVRDTIDLGTAGRGAQGVPGYPTVGLSSNGHAVLSVSILGGTLKVYDGERRNAFVASEGAYDAQFAPHGQSLAVAEWNKKVIIWQLGIRKIIGELHTSVRVIKCMAYAPDGTRLAVGGATQSLNERALPDNKGRGEEEKHGIIQVIDVRRFDRAEGNK